MSLWLRPCAEDLMQLGTWLCSHCTPARSGIAAVLLSLHYSTLRPVMIQTTRQHTEAVHPACSLGHGGEVRGQRGGAPERAARGPGARVPRRRAHAADAHGGAPLPALPGLPGLLPLR